MVKMTQTTTKTALFSNKWLLFILLMVALATLWTALHGDVTNVDAENDLSVQRSSDNPQKIAKQALPLSKRKVSLNHESSFIPWEKLKREPLQEKSRDLFKVHSWVVIPTVKKMKPVPPPAPVAPLAPFIYVGKLEDTPKGTQIFLMENTKLYTVIKGEKINALWRFDGEDTNTVRLTYLPFGLVKIVSKTTRKSLPTVVEEN